MFINRVNFAALYFTLFNLFKYVFKQCKFETLNAHEPIPHQLISLTAMDEVICEPVPQRISNIYEFKKF